MILSVFDSHEHHTPPTSTSSTSRPSSSHFKTVQRSVPPSITIAAILHLSLIQPAPLLPCGLRHCSTRLALTPVLEFSQSAALPSPRPSLLCGLHYCPRSGDVASSPCGITASCPFRAPNRNIISYLVSHFAMFPVFRSPPSCSFSLRRVSPFPQSWPPLLDSLLPPFVL
jgi:hypothetical protein